ncbi:NAD-dependent epimerase/dehydratase family protein [Thermodesulfobacteriota bacterium]
MKIIITGATGFLGRNLAEHFHDDGMQVVITGRSPDVGDELQKKGIEFQKADILDLNELNHAVSFADCLIHCAARSGPWGRYRDFYENNVVGTQNVVSACRNHGIKKIIFISTPSVYFTGEDRYDISESEPLPERQASHYSKTKLISERELLALQHEGFKVIIFRPRALFGPYDNTFVPRILRLAEKKQMPLVNDGQALIDITYVDDFVDAVRKALFAPDDAWNEVYNISNGDPISVKEWFSEVLRIFDRPFRPKNIPEPAAKILAGIMEFVSYLPLVNREPPMTRFSVGYMAKSMTLNIDKAKQKLGYSPRVSNQEGFEKYAEWYNANRQKGFGS